MKNKSSFSLIECLVYLAFFANVSMLFFGVASRSQIRFMRNISDQEVLIKQEIAVDLLRRDLMSSSAVYSEWDVTAGVFRKITLTSKNLPKHDDISWFIGNHGLMRASGQYNFDKREWITKISCVVCKSIKQIEFALQKNGKNDFFIGVWVTYKSDYGQEKKLFVKFRNKVIG